MWLVENINPDLTFFASNSFDIRTLAASSRTKILSEQAEKFFSQISDLRTPRSLPKSWNSFAKKANTTSIRRIRQCHNQTKVYIFQCTRIQLEDNVNRREVNSIRSFCLRYSLSLEFRRKINFIFRVTSFPIVLTF